MSAWMSTNRKPVIPSAARALSHFSETLIPKLFNGPKVKLKVSKIKADNEMPLFRIKNGNSLQGTGPAMWYRRME